jgi:hypothetical protein
MHRHVYFYVHALLLAVLCGPARPAAAQGFGAPMQYTCYRSDGSLVIDGRLDEASWGKAPWSTDFVDIEGDLKPRPPLRTRLKMLWDERYLYIAAEMEEPHIQARLQQHDTIIFHDNDFEVFIDPDGDTHEYFEIEINAFNTIMDLFMAKPYRNGGRALLSWDTKGIRTAVHINGTLNNPSDKDRSWTVEIAVPFRSLSFFNGHRMPRDSSCWRINFSRVEWDTDIREGRYIKRTDPATGKALPEHNWVWSPQGIINMHAPEHWGYLWFSSQPAGGRAAFALPEAEKLKQQLWLVYYKQQQYRQQHGRYAPDLNTLGQQPVIINGSHLQLEGLTRQFSATLGGWSIDQEGKISKD